MHYGEFFKFLVAARLQLKSMLAGRVTRICDYPNTRCEGVKDRVRSDVVWMSNPPDGIKETFVISPGVGV